MDLGTPGTSKSNLVVSLETELHSLAQPLTSLQCRLEIGILQGTEGAAREALGDGLTELQRVLSAVAHLREVVRLTSGEGLEA